MREYERLHSKIYGNVVGPKLRASLDRRAVAAFRAGEVNLPTLARLLALSIPDAKNFLFDFAKGNQKQ